MAPKLEELLREQNDTAGYIERFMENTLKTGKEKLTIGFYGRRQDLLETYWNTFYSTHRALMRIREIDETEYYIEKKFEVIELRYSETADALGAAIAKLRAEEQLAAPAPVPPVAAQLADPLDKQVNLPKVNLPTFDGDSLQWESFKDQFKSLIHDRPGLTNVQKLLYLKSCLTGDAAECIKNTRITNNGYNGAWEDLVSRYENIRLLSEHYWHAIYSLPPMKKSNPTELKRLLDSFRQIMRAFEALKKPMAAWDENFVYILTQKLDKYTKLAWGTSLENSRSVPRFDSLANFLENRVHALESVQAPDPFQNEPAARDRANNSNNNKSAGFSKPKTSTYATSTRPKNNTPRSCILCSEAHGLGYCPKYKTSTLNQKMDILNKNELCYNCYKKSHIAEDCNSPSRCMVCSAAHHTFIHEHFASSGPTNKGSGSSKRESLQQQPDRKAHQASAHDSEDSSDELNASCSHASSVNTVVLLATAQVRIFSPSGNSVVVRALLDTASDTTFLSEEVAKSLRLPTTKVRVGVNGIQGVRSGTATSQVQLKIGTVDNTDFSLSIPALLLNKVSSRIPEQSVRMKKWTHLSGLKLADPDFANPGKVDLLLGSDIAGFLFQDESRRGSLNEPSARLTPFGWVLLGRVEPPISNLHPRSKSANVSLCTTFSVDQLWEVDTPDQTDQVATKQVLFCTHGPDPESANECLSTTLQKFWELEEVGIVPQLSEEDKECESHFVSTHERTSSGRYVVRLPFKLDPLNHLFPSRSTAAALLISSERRLAKNTPLMIKYNEFMSEYLSLGHMVPGDSAPTEPSYFLPHHGVLKTHDPNQKIRVVFNASFKTKSGYSLNDCLMAGPKLQPDLWMILTRWRLPKIVFTADIIKMFRQIIVHLLDIIWQRILWRPEHTQKVDEFLLSTVTYGTSCAPYLALRVLRQLAADERNKFPLGAKAIEEASYVDDFFAGADDEDQALEIKSQLVQLLELGGFSLGKWASNSPRLCPENNNEIKHLQELDGVSTLGLLWNPVEDVFSLKVMAAGHMAPVVTKRSVLSEIARLFDPLGWFAPVLIFAKVFLQDLWITGLDWDQELPEEFGTRWRLFRSELPLLESLTISRWVNHCSSSDVKLELHGFSDASERAYAATVYLCIRHPDGSSSAHLLVAKTKVAPVKTLSIPRLELCGALLLTRLIKRVQDGLHLNHAIVFAWTDSLVTLTWIRSHASRWTPFVANRVSEIQQILPAIHWRHVCSSENPADCATRGLSSQLLCNLSLWWHGPEWLKSPQTIPKEIPAADFDRSTLELKNKSVVLTASTSDEHNLLYHHSSLTKLVRVTAWCLRFFHNVKSRSKPDLNCNCRSGPLTPSEIRRALTHWVKVSQRLFFSDDLDRILASQPIRKTSALACLTPFLDDEGVLRVGGRLQNAQLTRDATHPIILAKECHLSRLLVRDAHTKTLHGGPQLTRNYLVQRYWILRNKTLVKAILRSCVICTRFSGRNAEQLMGNLPTKRLISIRPFITTGVDYAGPIMMRTTSGRGHKSYKGYICLFVCFTTKAIHLEAVSDLTSQAFLAAFRRFVSRRGMCQSLMSDNGTNFVGADKELRLMWRACSDFYKETVASLANDGIDWTFIPARGPHFGGLWEAGVKSVKHHLRRVIKGTTLTFEEMTTLLCQIEAVLNSRPLYEISTTSSDLLPLTPGHFLVGHPLTVVPEPGFTDFNATPTSRWRLISKMRDHFWLRWKKEYLHGLQPRHIWRRERPNLKEGSLVLIKDDLSPPARWPLARVIRLHHGRDGAARVAELQTENATMRRPIVKLCPLPVATDWPSHQQPKKEDSSADQD